MKISLFKIDSFIGMKIICKVYVFKRKLQSKIAILLFKCTANVKSSP